MDSTLFVAPDGTDTDEGGGTRADPLRTIQHAMNRAHPGDTVHVLPGRYFETVRTVRSGTAENPITITGPPEAVLSGLRTDGFSAGLITTHSHIRLTGLTINGLQESAAPDDVNSYLGAGIHTHSQRGEISSDIVLTPHAIGNTRGALVDVGLVQNAEVGGFRVIGPAGLEQRLGDAQSRFGEIVSLGSGGRYTETVHVHHIDNRDGHPHTGFVETGYRASDVVIEYCTDGDRSETVASWPASSVRLQGYETTLRWCELHTGSQAGVVTGSQTAAQRQKEKPECALTVAERRAGTGNSIYGNTVLGYDAELLREAYQGAFVFPEQLSGQTPAAQRRFCGNEYSGPTEGDPGARCPDGTAEGNGVGHTGGNSPWPR